MRRLVLATLIALCLTPVTDVTAQSREVPASRFHTTFTNPTVLEIQYALKSFGYSLATDGVNGPVTQRAVRHFQKANGLTVDAIVGEETWAVILAAAAATEPAVRVNPPASPPFAGGLNGLPFAPSGLDNCSEAYWLRAQAGLPDAFDALIWRESNCKGNVGNSCCVGLLALHKIIFRDHRMIGPLAACGATWFNIRGDDQLSKQRNLCSAKALYDLMGLSPWRLG